jgi:uncharacterized membrane protein YcaP (DUF421 family)
MGKRQIGEMQPFEFIVTLIIADLTCIPMADVSIPLIYGIVAMLTLFLLHQLLALIERTGNTAKRILSGKPSIVINKMGVDMKELKKNNLGVDDLIESMRALGYYSLDDLSYAIFESNGKLSPMENENIENKGTSLPLLIVDDGKLVKENLSLINTTQNRITNFIESIGGKMQEKVVQENKMGIMPVSKLIITMSLPIMASMLVQALYNIVDSIFVAKISENALTAVSMAFPIQNLMIAVGTGTGVGINALLARNLGAKNYKKVNHIANHAVFLAVLSYLLFLLIGFFGSEAFFRSQTDIEEIVIYGTQYIKVCCCFSLGIFLQIFFERMLQATGKTVHSMISQGIGAITNIILDPILIFGMFGLPAMGVPVRHLPQ